MRYFVLATLAALSTPALAAGPVAKPLAATAGGDASAQSPALRERMGQRQLDLLIASIIEDQQPQQEAKRATAERSASR